MSSARCKEANLWLAELQGGSLDEATRIRLQEHLDICTACSARAAQLDQLVRLLRAERTAPSERQVERMWKKIGTQPPGAADHAPTTALGWRRWALPAVGMAAALVVAVAWWGRRDMAPPAAHPGQRPVATTSLEQLGWRVLAEAGVTWRDPSRAFFRVGAEGMLKLASARQVVVARPDSVAQLEGRRRIRLKQGGLFVATLQKGHHELEIVAGQTTLRPVGTAFEVRLTYSGGVSVAVVEGSVEVRRADERLVVEAGQRLSDRGVVALNAKRAAALRAERHELAQQLVPTLSARPPRRPAPAPSAPGGERPARPAVAHAAAQGETAHRGSGTSLSRNVSADDVRRVERMLAAGQPRASRLLALSLLRHPSAARHAPLLATLVAETSLREHDYASARRAYLRVWRRYPRSPLAADALYMVGSIELDQLGTPRGALRRFEGYLRRYPLGRQVQGAFLLGVRAASRARDDDAAARIASRYLKRFPRGEYAAFMRQQAKRVP